MLNAGLLEFAALGETNSIVEGQTKGLMGLFTTFATIEEVLLDIVTNGEQGTAGSVQRSVLAIGAGNTLDDGS